MSYRIGICGYGYVGGGMHKMFGDWVTAIYDPSCVEVRDMETDEISYQRYGMSRSSGNRYKRLDNKKDFENIDLAIVCVPTPMKESGQCDISIVEETIDWLYKVGVGLVLIKSTIEPGTTEKLQAKYPKTGIAFSPEYMGEGGYFTPKWLYPDPTNPISHGFMVLGGEDSVVEEITHIFIKKMGPHTKFTLMSSREAEIVKYWENIWGAMKVIFTNQMYDCIKALGGSFYRAREGWATDPRTERMHTAVFEKARGFSGKCYPKDLRAFIYATEKAGFNPELLKMIWNLNCEYRPKEFKKIK